MSIKIDRIKKQDDIEYRGDSIRLEKRGGDDEVLIWVTYKGQGPIFGRIDMNLEALKELSRVLPEFIKEIS